MADITGKFPFPFCSGYRSLIGSCLSTGCPEYKNMFSTNFVRCDNGMIIGDHPVTNLNNFFLNGIELLNQQPGRGQNRLDCIKNHNIMRLIFY